MPRNMISPIRAFTLIELLVVIFIIGLPAAILFPALSSVFESGRKKACQAEIQQMEAALRLYEGIHRDFPPSTLRELGLQSSNNVNEGAEVVVACLSGGYQNSSYFEFPEERLENSDDDLAPTPIKNISGSVFDTYELFEFTDPWGNPYIYFHGRELLPTTRQAYMLNGKKISLAPDTIASKTGLIRGSGRYQITSVSIDGEYASEDDLKSK